MQAKLSQQDPRGIPGTRVAGRSCQGSCSLSGYTEPQGGELEAAQQHGQSWGLSRAAVGCVVLLGQPGWHSMGRVTAQPPNSSAWCSLVAALTRGRGDVMQKKSD